VHALIVVTPPPEQPSPSKPGERISIFPGSASPTVFPARTPFWIGYGFTAGPVLTADRGSLDEHTRFELALDGEPVALVAELAEEDGVPVSKLEVAGFPDGLESGWHRFVGRWYDEGALVLTTDQTVQFVERGA
jgi:hypothetical protein